MVSLSMPTGLHPSSILFPYTTLFRSDRALQFAVADGRSCIDRQIVQLAWSDLQQLPTPWETPPVEDVAEDRKSTRLNSSHLVISYAVFCLKKKQTSIYNTGLT